MTYAPFVRDDDDRIASLCQLQIFFALLASVMLKYSPETLSESSNVDALLSLLTILPICLAVYTETPLSQHLSPSQLATYWKGFRQRSGFWPPPPEAPTTDEDPGSPSRSLADPSVDTAWRTLAAWANSAVSTDEASAPSMAKEPAEAQSEGPSGAPSEAPRRRKSFDDAQDELTLITNLSRTRVAALSQDNHV